MKKSFVYWMVMVGVSLALGSCMRNDDEPTFPLRPIARLYVSVDSMQTDDAQDPIPNVLLIDPADTLEMNVVYSYNSGAPSGAGGVFFSPHLERLIQAGLYPDTNVRLMTVGNRGTLATSGTIGNRLLSNLRGVAYNHNMQLLYVLSNQSPTSIYGFLTPRNKNAFTRPDRTLRLPDGMRPWSAVPWNDSLLVSNSGATPGISLFGNLSSIRDTAARSIQSLATLRIEGATAIRGFAFVDSLDLLVVADYGTGTGANPVADGRIYIIEGIKSRLASGTTTVAPTRTIAGARTGLVGPIDVAVDPRGAANRRTIFVADQNERRVSRFKLSDDGNVAPENSVVLDTLGIRRRPYGIFLDVRGVAQN